MDICQYIDHTLLRPATTLAEIGQLCKEAVQYRFAAVCLPPPFVKTAKELTADTGVKTATVIGFPFGYSAIEAKSAEIVSAIGDGADELDMVINITALKNKDWDYLEKEIAAIMPLMLDKEKTIKIIIESGILDEAEIIACCRLYGKYQVQFLKTSTGYAEKGATVEAVALMRKHLPDNIRVKASGGIRSFEFAKQLISAGAARIGCSASVQIVEQSKLPVP